MLLTKVKYHLGMGTTDKKYYTAKELAEMLGLNVMTIYRYINAGKLKAYKIGKEYRIDKSEFDRFMQKSKTK
ncbi:MAG TPA: helix-turn-helix domain-containing protein [Candidatus Paceibacterota bacterium]|nr:helix-turn-helix domain-containing protein [Candidatus Paceibacterota bacterium]